MILKGEKLTLVSDGKSKIYVSYAWGEESEKLIALLETAFERRSVEIVYDQNELNYKDSIREYMRELGKGRCVVVIVNAKYLKSKNCMFELLEIANQGRFRERIFPVVLADAGIFDAHTRLGYVRHWESQIEQLDIGLRSVNSQANLQGFREDIDLFTAIRAACAKLMDILADMNVLSPKRHAESDFHDLIASIDEMLNLDATFDEAEVSEIAEAERRKQRLAANGLDSSGVQQEILDLKRHSRLATHPKSGMSLYDGRYLLEKLIGTGGFGTVWRARDRKLELSVAVKILHPHKASEESHQRFFRGSQKMAELKEGVVKVLNPGIVRDGFSYYVMELVEGGNLEDAVVQGLITSRQAVPIMIRLCQILESATASNHGSEKFAHRDIKPSNILLGPNAELKLSDFDLVATGDTTGFTRGSGAIGSGSWSAPELSIAPDTADARADIFSIAMTGIFVLNQGNFNNYVFRDNRKEFVHRLTDDVVVRKCLTCATASDPSDRFQSMTSFRRALDGDISQLPKVQSKPRRSGKHLSQDVRTPSGQKKRFPMPRPTRKQIENALTTFDETLRHTSTWENFQTNRNHRYAIKVGDQLYPVKMILELAGGKNRGNLSGTIDQYRAIVVSLGFEVVEKVFNVLASDVDKD